MPINPKKITDFNRTDAQLELFWIFSIMVAGKNSDQTAKVISRLFRGREQAPFQYLRENENALRNTLVANRTGQYTRYERAIKESLNLNLRTASIEELESVFGVGPKTSRFFLLHTRGGEYVVLDTHILKWLKAQGMMVPDSTPTDKRKYAMFEKMALFVIKGAFPGLSLADADLLIWSSISGRLEENPNISLPNS